MYIAFPFLCNFLFSALLNTIFPAIYLVAFVLRDGVSESQFNQVLNIELEQIIKVAATISPLH